MKKEKCVNPRLGCVGGQAVMEGVMMKSREGIATAVRRADGKIVVSKSTFKTVRDKYKIFRVPVIRGIVNMIETMIFSFSTITESAEMLGIEEEPSKFELWLKKHFGASIFGFASVIGIVLGLALAMGFFIFLPTFLAGLVDKYLFTLGWGRSLFEGVLKILIFIGYLLLISLMPDIKRLFMYHGAEHKSIFCYESGEELTVDNVRKQKRFHPRCGTSFIFVVLLVSILVGTLITAKTLLWRILLKTAVLLPVVGISFEYIMYAGKHDNVLTRILSAPGLWMQRITTKEPDDSMIEVAIVSVKSALRKEFPDFEVPEYKPEVKTEEKPAEAPADAPAESENEETKDGEQHED